VRVISLAEIYPGPYATLLLSDLGADVVMIERTGGGDPARGFPALFGALNRGKRSAAIDIKQPVGIDCARRLIDGADVLVEGFRPGVMERLGLGADVLRERNPGLIYASLTGFGPGSPYGTRPAHDLSFQALAGVLGPEPTPPGVVPWADVVSGVFGALGIIAALLGRERTGRGTHVDVAMLDGLLSAVTPSLFGALNGLDAGLPPHQPGYGCFATADGRLLSLSVTVQDAFWRRLCAALELDDVADLSLADRESAYDELVGRRSGPGDENASCRRRRWQSWRGVVASRANVWRGSADAARVPPAHCGQPAEHARRRGDGARCGGRRCRVSVGRRPHRLGG
jgi:crotonobetainyl-CoA:carnitine CoA-transferase CaiB-like acyl-CoA transferase